MLQKTKVKRYFFLGIGIFLSVLLYNASYLDLSVEELKKTYANEHSKFIDVEGMQVHYRDEGKGFPIVLIHGTGASLHTWDDWTAKLIKNYRVIRLDLPAFGLTGPNGNADYSIEKYTYFLQQFLSKLKLDTFYLAGNSLGGNIAWNYTAMHPKRVAKLILLATSGLPTNKAQPAIFALAKMPIINSLFLFICPQFIIRKNIEEVYADKKKIKEGLITRYHKMALRTGNRKAFIQRAKIDRSTGGKAVLTKLKSINTPTLLIWGAKDIWIPLENGKRMHQILPHSKLVVLKNSGHVPMEESPQESLKALRSFLKE